MTINDVSSCIVGLYSNNTWGQWQGLSDKILENNEKYCKYWKIKFILGLKLVQDGIQTSKKTQKKNKINKETIKIIDSSPIFTI